MHLTQHVDRTRKAFGDKGYEEVHRFLDQYFNLYGPYHRVALHHKMGVELCVQKFGEEVRPVVELHILDDMGEIRNSWRDFTFDLHNADTWLPKTMKRQADMSLMDVLNKLYPEEFDVDGD